jgi:hypothetical protein
MCGCSEKLANLLGNTYSVMGIIKPNARSSEISFPITLKTERLTKKDVMILCGGTNDVAKNDTNVGLSYLSKFVKQSSNTNVITMYVPHKFDLQPTSVLIRKWSHSTGNYRKL